MSLPKKRNIDLTPTLVGQSRIDQLMLDTDKKTSYLPLGINIKDLETGFKEFIEELNFTLDGNKVPILFFTKERWASFSQEWKYIDKDKQIIMPSITIRRAAPPKPGTSVITKYNIPGRKTFTYMRVPTFDGTTSGVDIFKIPQPISVDLSLEVRILSKYTQDINKFNELILTDFCSRQSYMKTKGYFFPIVLDDVGEEGTMENFDQDRFYNQVYSFTLMGYLQNENEFETIKGVKKIIVFTEVRGDYPTISGSTVSGGT